MPELPEVETVKETLKPMIIGRSIKDIIVFYDGIIKRLTVAEFKKKLINQKFTDIRRLGKYLFFDLEDYTLTSHLRMEGKYYLRNSLDDLSKHEHIAFLLDNGKYLTYHDVRKFGTMEITKKGEESTLKSVQILGKEVIDPTLTTEYLYPLIKKSNRPIKSLLLDQHIISGLGNIYVDETLYLSKLNPQKKGSELTFLQVDKIVKSAKKVLIKAIKLGGTTIRTYQSTLGVNGRFQNELHVHTLVNEPCHQCNDIILKTRVGGRGTYYCPTCQRNDSLLIIGLTGGIASGKSYIADWFKKRKVTVIDADKIYKTLLKTNKIMYNEIVKTFGTSVVKNNQIDRKTLGNIVFNDDEKRLKLNEITHKFVKQVVYDKISATRSKKKKLIVLDIPLLFEVSWDYICDLIMLSYVDKPTQIQRLIARDQITEMEAIKKIDSQMDLEIKKEKSDIVIDNNHDFHNTDKQIKEIYDKLRSDGYVN